MRSSVRPLAIFLASAGLGFLLTRAPWSALRWRLLGPRLEWPAVDSYELRFDVREAGRFEGSARVDLSQVAGRRVTFLLNRNLRVSEAETGGQPVEVTHSSRLPSRYHREGRVVSFDLPEAPADGTVSLSMTYAGEAESGGEGPDWRGILYVGADEVRMCEQTVFYPQVPLSLEGSAKARAPFAMTVVAPREWELFVPAPGGVAGEEGEARAWSFRTEGARHPALLGGVHERTETRVDGSTIVTLLRAEHARLAPDFAREASRAIEHYGGRFGRIDAGVVGIVEIRCRDSSYNWTAEGVMAFDRGALAGSVPVPKVAHEVAHLWWGQAVDATGPGERFLTEGLAEYSAWTYLLDDGRSELVLRSIDGARSAVAGLTSRGGSLALADVGFGTPDYSTLAYDKGALVLRCLRAQLAEGRLDAALRRLVEIGSERQVGLDDFLREVRGAAGRDDLRVPWIDASGDVALALEDVRVEGGELFARIAARTVPADSEMQVAGTPVALEFGGRGWSERMYRTLDGKRTGVRVDLGERALAYVHLDPDGGWTSPVEGGLAVLNGARLVRAEPGAGASVAFGGTQLVLELDRALGPVLLEDLQAVQLAAAPDGVYRFGLRGVALRGDGRELAIETEPWLPDRRYALSLGSPLVDADGLPIAVAYELAVEPSTDVEPARIVSSVPANGSSVAAPGGRLDLVLTFDGPMRSGYAITGDGVREIRRRGHRYPDLDGHGRWDDSWRSITFPCQGLEAGGTYALPVRSRSFHDLSGNGCEELDLVFRVVSTD